MYIQLVSDTGTACMHMYLLSLAVTNWNRTAHYTFIFSNTNSLKGFLFDAGHKKWEMVIKITVPFLKKLKLFTLYIKYIPK